MSQLCSSTEPLENVLFAISFMGWPCVTGRLSSELADFEAVLLASWAGRAALDPADCAASLPRIVHYHFCSSSAAPRCEVWCRSAGCVHVKVPRRLPRCHVALLKKRDIQF